MKIQFSFVCRKNSRSVFNENKDQIGMKKNFRFVFNENTDQFCIQTSLVPTFYFYHF